MPTDCGFQPVIGFLPQMSQARAIRISIHERTGAPFLGAAGTGRS
jgi:hypothetical protein